ncbi:MAG: hypothetical protein ABI147_09815 [Acidobacteriaceae bacterium]
MLSAVVWFGLPKNIASAGWLSSEEREATGGYALRIGLLCVRAWWPRWGY